MKVWFLSFVGGERDGAVIVRAEDLKAAIRRSWELKLNPGGDVLGVCWPDEPEVAADVEARFGGFEKFITRAQLDAMPNLRRVTTLTPRKPAGGMVN